MVSTIIFGLIFSVSVGLMFSLIMVNLFFPKYGYKVIKTIFIIIFSLLIGFGLIGLLKLEHKIDTENYNEGVCEKCYGHYTIFDVEKDRHGYKTYYYKCDNCGRVISTHCLFE